MLRPSLISWGGRILRKGSITLWGSWLRWVLCGAPGGRGCSPLARRSCFCWPRKFRGIWEFRILRLPTKWTYRTSQLHLCKLPTSLGCARGYPGGVSLPGVRESPSQVRCHAVLLVGSSGSSSGKEVELRGLWSGAQKVSKTRILHETLFTGWGSRNTSS